MSLFTNYDNLPETYVPNNMRKQNPVLGKYPPVKPLEEYNAKGELVGYSWKYGDNVVLNFKLSGYVTYDEASYNETVATYLSSGNQKLVFNIYDFRFNSIYEAEPLFKANDDGTVTTMLFIYDMLSQVMVKGVYYVSLAIEGTLPNPLYNPEDPESSPTTTVKQTLFKPDECVLIVK